MKLRNSLPRGSTAAFSLVEAVLVLAILSVAMGLFARTVASSRRLDPIAVETGLAAEAARVAIERLRAHPVDQIVALYNDDPADDPDGAGTAPGPFFDVPGLVPVGVNGRVGRIEFPAVDGVVREDVANATLGMPRDLSGDGVIDGAEHTSDWVVLPLRVRIEWAPRGGAPRRFDIHTMVPRL